MGNLWTWSMIWILIIEARPDRKSEHCRNGPPHPDCVGVWKIKKRSEHWQRKKIESNDWNCYDLSHLTDYDLRLTHNTLPSAHKQLNATVSIWFITLKLSEPLRVLSHFFHSASYGMITMAKATVLQYAFITNIVFSITGQVTLFCQCKPSITIKFKLPRTHPLNYLFSFMLSSFLSNLNWQENRQTEGLRLR